MRIQRLVNILPMYVKNGILHLTAIFNQFLSVFFAVLYSNLTLFVEVSLSDYLHLSEGDIYCLPFK